MKLFIVIIFFLISFYSYSQEPTPSNDIPELVKKNNICKALSFAKESSAKKYISRKIDYDTLGRSLLQIDFDSDSSIDSRIISYYLSDTLEMDIYIDSTSIDTAIYIYKNKMLSAEYWYWGEDKSWDDSTLYFYDSTNKLILKTDGYLARNVDSLKYSNNKLIHEIRYNQNDEIEKDIFYTYSNNLLISKIEKHKYLKGDSTYYTYNKKLKLKIKKGNNYRTTYFYYKNNYLRKRRTRLINVNAVIETTIIYYDKNGFAKKIKSFLGEQKNALVKTKYIKCLNARIINHIRHDV